MCPASGKAAQPSQPERQQTAETATPAPAARVKLTGLPYFGTVSTQLYRGAQPEDSGFAELKKLGIGIVVNLRHEPDEIARERGLVEQQGMQYVSIPWRGKAGSEDRRRGAVPGAASRESGQEGVRPL